MSCLALSELSAAQLAELLGNPVSPATAPALPLEVQPLERAVVGESSLEQIA